MTEAPMTERTTPSRPGPAPDAAIEWAVSPTLVDYEHAIRCMEARVLAIRQGEAAELVWLLEHPPLYTAGTSAAARDLVDPRGLPVYTTGRGGQYTYHGPGQRIAYVMLDVQRRFGGDVRAFVGALESWIIATLADYGLAGETRDGRVGVWIASPRADRVVEEKIAAIGIRIRHGVSFHGVSLNVAPNLEHYAGIVPCGIAEHGVTSFAALGRAVSIETVDISLRRAFEARFAPTTPATPPEAPGLPPGLTL